MANNCDQNSMDDQKKQAPDTGLPSGCIVVVVVAVVALVVIYHVAPDQFHTDSRTGPYRPNVVTGIASIAIAIVFFGLVGLLLTALSALGSTGDKNRLEEEKVRKEEEERQRHLEWNSPEAVEQRRLETERLRVEAEEKERQRKVREEIQARAKWERYYRCVRIEEVDGMTGVQFETFIGTLFERLGHKNVRGTKGSGDQGADLVCDSPDNKHTVVQTKRWKGRVGNSAIQEVLGALLCYDAEVAFVITSSYFTDSAKALAAKHGRVHLVDRVELARMIQGVFPREVPEFDQDQYNTHVMGWSEGLLERPDKRKPQQPPRRKRRWNSRKRW
jgi:hypothetical protein